MLCKTLLATPSIYGALYEDCLCSLASNTPTSYVKKVKSPGAKPEICNGGVMLRGSGAKKGLRLTLERFLYQKSNERFKICFRSFFK